MNPETSKKGQGGKFKCADPNRSDASGFSERSARFEREEQRNSGHHGHSTPERPDAGYPGVYGPDPNTTNNQDFITGTNSSDVISTGDDSDTVSGGGGRDTIYAGVDDDIVSGGNGHDSLIGGEGNDLITGGSGKDTIYGGNDGGSGFAFPEVADDGSGSSGPDLRPDNDRDTIYGGNGKDVIYGDDDDDVLFGEQGNDFIDGGWDDDLLSGGQGRDTLLGGQGDDTIDGGEGPDSLFGGADEDLFIGLTEGDAVDGGSDGSDFDTLDLTGSAGPGGTLSVAYTSTDEEDGVVTYYDPSGTETGHLTFTEIENVVPCFTPGTRIATPTGEVAVETLCVGDRVITRDNGTQTIRWVGAKGLTGAALRRERHLRPVRICKGALGRDLPERDMLVSPNHRMLVANSQTALYFEDSEVLVAAKHLTGLEGVDIVDVPWITYVHVLFDQHEVILADGAWTESFQPGALSLSGVGNAQRFEILELFPELGTRVGAESYAAARRSLKRYEATLLTR